MAEHWSWMRLGMSVVRIVGVAHAVPLLLFAIVVKETIDGGILFLIVGHKVATRWVKSNETPEAFDGSSEFLHVPLAVCLLLNGTAFGMFDNVIAAKADSFAHSNATVW